MMKFLKKHWEVLSYLIFGVLTTLLNILLYALFSRLFGYTAANSWGNVLDNALCILFAYCTNRAFVFRSRTQGREMAKEFGAFVRILPGVDGLVHISEISNDRVEKVSDALKVGDMVDVKLLDVDFDKKRISLSMKALLNDDAE